MSPGLLPPGPSLFPGGEQFPGKVATAPTAATLEKILIARRCFKDAQSLLQGAVIGQALTGTWEAGWYDTAVSPEVGSFAVVNPSSKLALLAGRVIRVGAQDRSCFVYVLGGYSGMTWPLALQRRAFLALGLLSKPALDVGIEVVG